MPRTTADIHDFQLANGNFQLWLEVPVSLLSEEVFDILSAKWSRKNIVKNDAGEITSYEMKTLDEYVFKHTRTYSKDGSKVVILLSAVECDEGSSQHRNDGMTEASALHWVHNMSAVGFDMSAFMTTTERNSFIKSNNDYNMEVV